MKRVWLVAAAFVAVAAVLIALLFVPAIGNAVVAGARWLRSAGALGALAFWAAYVVGSLALVPDTVFSVAAGYAYGALGGFALGLIGAWLSAAVTFALARGRLRAFAARRFRRDRRALALDRAVGEHGATVVILVRVAPVLPFAVTNYLFTMTAITPRAYLVGTAAGMVPWTLAYACLGSSAPIAIAVLHGHAPTAMPVVGLAIAIVAGAALSWLAHRELRRRMPRT